MRISFVILHYQNYKDTHNCVESLLRLPVPKDVEMDIIILDNGSPNKSGEKLLEECNGQNNIEVILLGENLGFSKANNIGYKKAKERKADAVAILNNDIVFENESFLEELKKTIKSNVDIICPDIINLNGQHQNPMREAPLDIRDAKKGIKYRSIVAKTMKIPIIRKVVYDIDQKRNAKWEKEYYSKRIEKTEKAVPYGAFLVFANKWVVKEDVAFPSNTFMYMEEDFLSRYAQEKDYKVTFNDALIVRHLEGGSTKKSNNLNKYAKLEFQYRTQANAMQKYFDLYKRKKQ